MLAVQGIHQAFNGVPVLRGIDLEVAAGEILCLLGPSGCGKTTLLRVIAGLERPQQGEVLLEKERITGRPVHERDFGLMFQDFALFPHMNVAQNVMFGLKMHGQSRAQQQQRASEMLRLVRLDGFERRDISQLSGGEKQRVALGRSLAPQPRLLMLDEPLGSLDAALREQLVVELREIIKSVGLTAIYVTHDQHEAFAIADRIAVMNAGHIEQVGTPQTIYQQPGSVFVARFLGLHNILPVTDYENGMARTAVGDFASPTRPAAVLLHPDGIYMAEGETVNVIAGRVAERVFLGDSYRLRVICSDDVSLSFRTATRGANVPEVGANIRAGYLPEMIIPLYA